MNDHKYIERFVSLLDPNANTIFNSTVADAVEVLGTGDAEKLLQIDGRPISYDGSMTYQGCIGGCPKMVDEVVNRKPGGGHRVQRHPARPMRRTDACIAPRGAQGALLGVARGLVLGIDLTLGIALTGVIFAIAIVMLQRHTRLASDTLLGILAHAALAAGLIAISFRQGLRVDLLGYLFGDILAVSPADLTWIYLGGGLSLSVLALSWRGLLAVPAL